VANYGHTRITATGPQPDLAALLAHVRATARDGLDFTLSGLFAPMSPPTSWCVGPS